ncbi:hypothetical protein GF312_16385 [Candidatus Poribacteria bacterium]|nr:hypothetical protein [Candidatus Poribacteria bacterium]
MSAYRCLNTWVNQIEKCERNNNVIIQRYVDVFRFTGLIKGTPDVRKQKVERIKKLIKSGEYNIPSGQVARSMIKIHKDLVV